MVVCRVSSRADHFSGNTTPFEAFQIWIDQGGCLLRKLPLTFFFSCRKESRMGCEYLQLSFSSAAELKQATLLQCVLQS